MVIQLLNNPLYKVAATFDGINVFIPVDDTQYHMERYIAATAQQIYSDSGATKDVLGALMDEMIQKCNNEKDHKTLRTDIGTLANNIKYRLQYPIDEDCAIRMGALLSFLADENPDVVLPFWTEKKVRMAHANPDAYTFFLSWGAINTPSYREQFSTSIDMDYFSKRRQTLASLLPPTLTS